MKRTKSHFYGMSQSGAVARCYSTAQKSVFLLVIFTLFMSLIHDSQAEIQLGEITFMNAPAATLPPAHLAMPGDLPGEPPGMPSQPPDMERFLNSYGFVSGVGGVAFGGLAAAPDGLVIRSLMYDETAVDGARLKAKISVNDESRRIVIPVHDWEFIPTARFVHDNGFACFTYFGRLPDEDDHDHARRTARGERILNYHPAFVNTLMGLRIMQADLLLLYPDACDLPKKNGEYILGPNEEEPDIPANRRRWEAMHNYLQYLPGRRFRSYVICDYKREVSFSLKDDRLQLSGTPIWFCWKDKVVNEAQRQRIHQSVQANANQQINKEFIAAQSSMGTAVAVRKYTSDYQRARFERLYDKEMSERMLKHMPDYSKNLTARLASLQGINPAVYSAIRKTMHMAALFRHVQQSDREIFKAFVKQIEGVNPGPYLETPTILYEPGARNKERP